MAHGRLLLHALAHPLVQARGRKRREGVVHVALLLAPLAVQGVRREELGLRGGALAREAGLEVGQVGGQLNVLVEGRLKRGVGCGEGRVYRRGGVGEGAEEGWVGEDVGDVLFPML